MVSLQAVLSVAAAHRKPNAGSGGPGISGLRGGGDGLSEVGFSVLNLRGGARGLPAV